MASDEELNDDVRAVLGYEGWQLAGDGVTPGGVRRRVLRRRAGIGLAAAVAVAFAGIGVGSLVGSGTSAQEPIEVIAPATPTPAPSAPPSPVPSMTATTAPPTPAPTAAETVTATTQPPQPSAAPSRDAPPPVTAQPVAIPPVLPSLSPAPPDAPGLSLSLTVDRPTARIGDAVAVALILRNDSSQDLEINQQCPLGFFAYQRVQLAPYVADGSPSAQLRAAIDGQTIAVGANPTCAEAFDREPLQVPRGGQVTRRYTWRATSANGAPFQGTVVLRGQVSNILLPDGTRTQVTSPATAITLSGGFTGEIGPSEAVDLALADPDVQTAVADLRGPVSGTLSYGFVGIPSFDLTFRGATGGGFAQVKSTGEVLFPVPPPPGSP